MIDGDWFVFNIILGTTLRNVVKLLVGNSITGALKVKAGAGNNFLVSSGKHSIIRCQHIVKKVV